MKYQLSSFNKKGIDEFEEFLEEKKPGKAIPADLLNPENINKEYSLDIEQEDFETKLHMLESLDANGKFFEIIDGLEDFNEKRNVFSWLAAVHWDKNFLRSKPPLDKGHYILGASSWNFLYRHMIYGPWMYYRKHRNDREALKLFLESRGLGKNVTAEWGEYHEQFLGRKMLRNSNAIFTAFLKYCYIDPSSGKPYRTAFSKQSMPGSLARYSTLINQFNRTYDFDECSAEQMFNLLGGEFKEQYDAVVNLQKS